LTIRKRLYAGLVLAGAYLLVLAGCQAPFLSVDDAVWMAGHRSRLGAYVGRAPVLGMAKDVERQHVQFCADGQAVGAGRTDDDGAAAVVFDLADDATQYEAQAVVDGRELRGTGRVFHWDARRVVIAVDIDRTIEQTQYQRLIFGPGEDESAAMQSSAETLNDLARDFQILYLTSRPRFLLDKTRTWLRERGFPDGPVVMATGLRQMIRAREYKLERLRTLRAEWPTLLIGIGDKPRDVDPYGANDMLAIAVPSKAGMKFGRHAIVLYDWRAVAEFFGANRAALADADALREIIAGRRLLLRPVERYRRQ
jgi:hypothetical protein